MFNSGKNEHIKHTQKLNLVLFCYDNNICVLCYIVFWYVKIDRFCDKLKNYLDIYIFWCYYILDIWR